MRELVRYTCSKCGAALNVMKTQQVFDCPFCGNSYDFAGLHRTELLLDAQNSLRCMEFTAANEKYDTLLASYPHDFDALMGLALCKLQVISFDSLKDPRTLQKCDFFVTASNRYIAVLIVR